MLKNKAISWFLLVASIPAAILVLNAYLARANLPKYGSWTGIRPLEAKIDLLERFAKEGPVDAVIVGSSIADFGFSAELYSSLMSKELGRKYRAFNFSTGGAELRTLPYLYRFMRTVALPKELILVVPAQQKIPEYLSKMSPDYTLLNSPVADYIDNQYKLNFSKKLWSFPLLNSAAALRDKLLFGNFDNIQSKIGSEAYALNLNGDRISYLVTWKAEDLSKYRDDSELLVKPFATHQSIDENLKNREDHFFSRRDLNALTELRSMANADGVKITLVSTASAATYHGGNITKESYSLGRTEFFQTLANRVGATWNGPKVLPKVPLYGVSDVTHLNIHGAELATIAAFQAIVNHPIEKYPMELESNLASLIPSKEKTFNLWSALLVHPKGISVKGIEVVLVDSLAVPDVPKDNVYFAIRSSEDVEYIGKAKKLPSGRYRVEFSIPASKTDEAVMLRVLWDNGTEKTALSNPVASYKWLE